MSDDTTPATPQVALVTGASRGIGRAIAQVLKGAGFKVIGTATTEAGAASITEAGLSGLVLDVTDGAALDAAIDGIVKQHGGLHVLVNNAGITRDMLSMRMKDDEWDAVHDTNLKAVFRACRAVTRPMSIWRSWTCRASIGDPTQSHRLESPALALAVTPSTAVTVLRTR